MAKLSIFSSPTQDPAPAASPTPFAATPLGIGVNTVKGILGYVPVNENPWLKVAGDIAHGITRTIGSLGLEVVNDSLSGIKTAATKVGLPSLAQGASDSIQNSVQVPSYLTPIFGADGGDIKDIHTRVSDAKTKLDANPLIQKLGLTHVSGALALGSIVGNTYLDLDGLGGEKSAITALTKETDLSGVANIMKKGGFSDEVIQKFAPQIAETTDKKTVEHLFDLAKGTEGIQTIARGSAEEAASAGGKAIEPTVAEQLAKTTDPFEAFDSLKTQFPNLSDTLLKKSATKVAAETNAAKIEKMLADTSKLDARMGTGEVKVAGQEAPAEIPTPEIPAAAASETITPTLTSSDVLKMSKEELEQVPNAQVKPNNFGGEDIVVPVKDNSVAPLGVSFDKDGNKIRHGFDYFAKAPKVAEEAPIAAEAKAAPEAAPVESPVASQEPLGEAKTKASLPRPAQTPAHGIAELTGGEDGKSWNSLLKSDFKNIVGKEKVHLLDYLATPEFVLEKIGLGKSAELLQDAKNVYRQTLKKEISKIEDWRKEVGRDPYASTRIFRYLDGQAKDVYAEMTDTDKRVANEIKQYLHEWADRLHLPEDSRISNYITHIFDEGAVEGKQSVFEDDPELAALMADKPAGSVYDPFVQQRLGKKGYKEDVWAALDAYVKRGSRKEAMDPVLEHMKDDAKHLDDASYNYVKTLTHRINMRPTEMDKLLDNFIRKVPRLNRLAKGPRPTMFLTQKIRQLFYRGTLGLNFGSALRNLSQGANTYAKLGEKYTAIGYTKLLGRMLTNNLEELKTTGVLSEELIQDKKLGVYKSAMQKLDPVLFGLFEVAEKINRGAAYYGAKSKAIGSGLSEEQAVKYAQRIVRETQFAFGAADSPVALASDIAKTATQLGTYNLKQIEFLVRMAKNKEFGGLIRYSLASLAFVYTIGKAMGMTVDQLIPSVGLGGSPVGNIVSGLGELMSSDSQTQADGKAKLQRAAVSLVPAGAQIRKTVQGISAYEKGRDTTPTGKTRFRLPKGVGSFFQNALFGKSATPEAQKYYNELGKKKTKSGSTPLKI